jgi:hypothetical protein
MAERRIGDMTLAAIAVVVIIVIGTHPRPREYVSKIRGQLNQSIQRGERMVEL